eukprot:TRINITY_DN1086_c0_g1_i2.p1 TRINITY_DN1086_c0_g1~~TRINITY_DN1086_c0_g1_i2.p1  ORF type:complete len:473 (-),score=48.75 TRINITY_DN1086_c0_g1_i2:174-1592(-)
MTMDTRARKRRAIDRLHGGDNSRESAECESVFSLLPDEVLLKILEPVHDFQHSLVCPRWLRLYQNSVTALYISPPADKGKQRLLLNSAKFLVLYPYLKSIWIEIEDISQWSVQLISAIRAFCPGVALHVERGFVSSVHNLEKFLRAGKSLRTLRLDVGRHTALPSSLGELENLEELHLGTGGRTEIHTLLPCFIPDTIGQLSKLKSLSVQQAGILSLTPSLALLTALEKLTIDCQFLLVVPESLVNLTRLKELSLTSYLISVLPEWLGRLQQLESLKIKCHELKVPPLFLANLPLLSKLTFSYSLHLTALPENLGFARSLRALDLRCLRYLMGLPESIGNLPCLVSLEISMCGALVSLPDSISKLQTLEYLSVASCASLTSLPKNIGALGALKHFQLRDCPLLQRLPPSLPRIASLETVILENLPLLRKLPTLVKKLRKSADVRISKCHGYPNLTPRWWMSKATRSSHVRFR